jgi:uncharacterized protein (TIGR03437 family)
LYVSPGQINFRIPEATSLGDAVVQLASSSASVPAFAGLGTASVQGTTPAIFQCPGLNTNTLIAVAEAADGGQLVEPGPCQDPPFTFPALVTFYGTGFDGATVDNTRVWVQGVPFQPSYVGTAGTVPGLDKIVVRIETNDLVLSLQDPQDPYNSWVYVTVGGQRTSGGYTGIY